MRKTKLTYPDDVLVTPGLNEGDCRTELDVRPPREAKRSDVEAPEPDAGLQVPLDELSAKANEGPRTD